MSRLTANLLVQNLVLVVAFSTLSASQQKPEAVPSSSAQEFPVVFQQSVTAGKTPVGTKIQAKLEVATLVNGSVIPRNAIFSGEVIESAGKTATGPSRLAIRMDSEQWKNGSASIKVYLTRWYYPTTLAETSQNLQYGPTQPASTTWNGAGAYPDPNSPAYKPFPGRDSDKNQSLPATPSAITSNHRILMKNVEFEDKDSGGVVLVSKHGNIKLDKVTTYVLAADDPQPPK